MNLSRRGLPDFLGRSFGRIVVDDQDFVDERQRLEFADDLPNRLLLPVGRQDQADRAVVVHYRCAMTSICAASGLQKEAR